MPPGIEDDRSNNHSPRDDSLGRLGNTDLRQPCLERCDDEHAKKRIDDRTSPAHEACATDHYGSDGGEFETNTRVWICRAKARGVKYSRQATERAKQRKNR